MSARHVDELTIRTPQQIVEDIQAAVAKTKKTRAALAETLLSRHLESLQRRFVDLMSGNKLNDVEAHEREMLVSVFYGGKVEATYFGIDSHLPSDFLKAYPSLLGNLVSSKAEENSSDECYRHRVVRIVPEDEQVLRKNFNESDYDRRAWEEYLRAHNAAGIVLLQVPKKVAEDTLKVRILDSHLKWTTDIGLWVSSCALMFERPGASNTRDLQLLTPDDGNWEAFLRYIKDLVEKANLMTARAGQLEFSPLSSANPELHEDLLWSLDMMFEPKLARRWHEFVAAEARLNREGEGELLASVLGAKGKKCQILDAAAGVGAETFWLMENGFKNVTSNEIDDILATRLKDAAVHDGRSIRLWKYDWRHLAEKTDPGAFDAVLVLGNSLTCLLEPKAMIRCLENFREVMADDGVLVIDERNYRYLINNRRRVSKSDYRIPSTGLYPGHIQAAPVPGADIRGSDELRLAYYDPAESSRRPIGHFTVYAFDEGEFESILAQAGFTVTDRFWNFKPAKRDDAEYITYLARKSQPNDSTNTIPVRSGKAMPV